MKIGDAVLYTAFGRTLKAIVFGIHEGDVSRAGADNEPILDLFYVDVERESEIARKKIGWEPSVIKDYGVVHASHEFSDAYRRAHGLQSPHQIATHRGQGEWIEAPDTEALQQRLNEFKRDFPLVAEERNKAQAETEELKKQNANLLELIAKAATEGPGDPAAENQAQTSAPQE